MSQILVKIEIPDLVALDWNNPCQHCPNRDQGPCGCILPNYYTFTGSPIWMYNPTTTGVPYGEDYYRGYTTSSTTLPMGMSGNRI